MTSRRTIIWVPPFKVRFRLLRRSSGERLQRLDKRLQQSVEYHQSDVESGGVRFPTAAPAVDKQINDRAIDAPTMRPRPKPIRARAVASQGSRSSKFSMPESKSKSRCSRRSPQYATGALQPALPSKTACASAGNIRSIDIRTARQGGFRLDTAGEHGSGSQKA